MRLFRQQRLERYSQTSQDFFVYWGHQEGQNLRQVGLALAGFAPADRRHRLALCFRWLRVADAVNNTAGTLGANNQGI